MNVKTYFFNVNELPHITIFHICQKSKKNRKMSSKNKQIPNSSWKVYNRHVIVT